MQIGFDARLVRYRRAGIGQYILRLTRALAALDGANEYHLFQNWRDQQRLVNAPNFYRHTLWTPSHNRFERTAMSLELLTHKFDVFHSPDFIPPRVLRARSVITIHDLAFLLYPRFLTPGAARYYGQIDKASRSAARIIAVSQSTKRDVTRLLGVPEERVSVIYEAPPPGTTPLDRGEARQWVEARYGVSGDFILFVGTAEPRKNLPTLLAAYSMLRDKYKQSAQLVVAGDKGWLTEEVDAALDKYHLGDVVRFVGEVSDEELGWLYNAAQVLALPSFYEGFGLPPLEAMASGTPVVVSNVSSLPEVVGDAGMLIAPGDADEWAAALYRVLTDEAKHAEMVEKGLKQAARFSWERTARETLEVYELARR